MQIYVIISIFSDRGLHLKFVSFGHTSHAVVDKRVINGSVLWGEDFDHFLCGTTGDECGDWMQLRAAVTTTNAINQS